MAEKLDRLLEEKYSTSLRPHYQWHDEIFMLSSFSEYRKKIEDFEVRDDDVWVTGFPKSGTTWTQEMVWLLCNDLDYDRATIDVHERVPVLETNAILDFKNYCKEHPDLEFPEYGLDPIGFTNKIKSGRIIKSHLPWNLLPLQIKNQATKAKIIHVIRNPKDVCVSYYHYSIAFEGARGTLDDFFKLFMAGMVVCGPYWNNVMSYWEKRNLPNILIITYEDMKKDLPSIIRKVDKFLDKKVPEGKMERLTKHLSFEEMRNNEAVNLQCWMPLLQQCAGYESEGVFIRSGIIGSHKSQMTEEMINIMDRWIEKNIAGTGLSFS